MVQNTTENQQPHPLTRSNLVRTGLLILLMGSYGLLITPVGFILATTLFLAGGYAIMGERRATLLLVNSFLPAIGFSALMSLLGIELPGGDLFLTLG